MRPHFYVVNLTPSGGAVTPGISTNARKLGGQPEDVDLRWPVVDCACVGGSFDAVVVNSVSLDDARVGSRASVRVCECADFFDGVGVCVSEMVRGKIPPSHWSGGGSLVCFA
jgi:hypothetical protein